MWIWIIIIFVVGGAILGFISSEGEGKGCLFGAFAGLLEGGSCLLQLFFVFLVVALACWIFG